MSSNDFRGYMAVVLKHDRVLIIGRRDGVTYFVHPSLSDRVLFSSDFYLSRVCDEDGGVFDGNVYILGSCFSDL